MISPGGVVSADVISIDVGEPGAASVGPEEAEEALSWLCILVGYAESGKTDSNSIWGQ